MVSYSECFVCVFKNKACPELRATRGQAVMAHTFNLITSESMPLNPLLGCLKPLNPREVEMGRDVAGQREK